MSRQREEVQLELDRLYAIQELDLVSQRLQHAKEGQSHLVAHEKEQKAIADKYDATRRNIITLEANLAAARAARQITGQQESAARSQLEEVRAERQRIQRSPIDRQKARESISHMSRGLDQIGSPSVGLHYTTALPERRPSPGSPPGRDSRRSPSRDSTHSPPRQLESRHRPVRYEDPARPVSPHQQRSVEPHLTSLDRSPTQRDLSDHLEGPASPERPAAPPRPGSAGLPAASHGMSDRPSLLHGSPAARQSSRGSESQRLRDPSPQRLESRASPSHRPRDPSPSHRAEERSPPNHRPSAPRRPTTQRPRSLDDSIDTRGDSLISRDSMASFANASSFEPPGSTEGPRPRRRITAPHQYPDPPYTMQSPGSMSLGPPVLAGDPPHNNSSMSNSMAASSFGSPSQRQPRREKSTMPRLK